MRGALLKNARWFVLGGLIVLNVVLISSLLVRLSTREVQAGPMAVTIPSATAPPRSTTSPGPSEDPSPTASAVPSETPATGGTSSPEPTADVASRMITANSTTVAWRAESTGCDRPATVELTTDGGKSWRRSDPGLRAIVRLRAYGDRSVFAVGADAQCRPTYAWLSAPGTEWRRDSSVIWDVWFTYPGDADRVHAAGGRTSRPCGDDLRSFASTGGSLAAVLCADGRIRSVDGDTWRTVAQDPRAVALGTDGDRVVVASRTGSCDTVNIRDLSRPADRSGQVGGCPAPAIAIAGAAGTTWRWIDDDVSVS